MKTKNLAVSGLFLSISLFFTISVSHAQVKIGTNPGAVNGNSVLELESTGKGVLLPRSTTGQIGSMTSVPTGMIVFNTTDSAIYLKRDTGWVILAVSKQSENPTLVVPSASAADAYAVMPTDNPLPIAALAPISFPQTNLISGGIARLSGSMFELQKTGVYHVSYVVSVTEAAQLALYINGALLSTTVSGRAAGNSQVAATTLITVTSPPTTIELRNVSATPITLTGNAGGTLPVAAHLSLIKVF